MAAGVQPISTSIHFYRVYSFRKEGIVMLVTNQLPSMGRASAFDSTIDRLFDEAARAVSRGEATWKPGCNVYEDEHGMTVELSVPGIDPGAIDVQIENDTVMVQGKRTWESPEGRVWYAKGIPEGEFTSAFRLPPTVDSQKSAASYKNGVLTIKFPKREEAKPRRISVEIQ
jgi:HSP20 family protein